LTIAGLRNARPSVIRTDALGELFLSGDLSCPFDLTRQQLVQPEPGLGDAFDKPGT
jgi:hypothetical protein